MSPKRELILGVSLGCLTAFVVSFITFFASNPGFKFADYFNIYVNGHLLAPILSVSLVGNLGLFFLFLKFDKDLISKGILMATIFVGIIIFVLKFF